MFTGIIEAIGSVNRKERSGDNIIFHVISDLSSDLYEGQSIAHNGVCLTVEKIFPEKKVYQVSAIAETLKKSNLGDEDSTKKSFNLERSIAVGGRLDGHFVQGHIDTVGSIEKTTEENGSRKFWISYPPSYEKLVAMKGSIALDGMSLTIVELHSKGNSFSVCLVPYTLSHTNAKDWKVGTTINIEFDILGKYVEKWMTKK